MGLYNRQKRISYRLGNIKFGEELSVNDNGKILFSSASQAKKWVDWLKNVICLSNQELIDEVEFQCKSEGVPDIKDSWDNLDDISKFNINDFKKRIEVNKALRESIYDVLFSCALCNKPTKYGDLQTIEKRELTGQTSRVISKGLTGGSVAREVANLYKIHHLSICPTCYDKEIKKKRISRLIKLFVIFGLIITIGLIILLNVK